MSDAVIIAGMGLIGTIVSVLVSGFVYIKLGRVETKVDGKMDKLLAASVGQAHAEGMQAGTTAEQARTATIAQVTLPLVEPPKQPPK